MKKKNNCIVSTDLFFQAASSPAGTSTASAPRLSLNRLFRSGCLLVLEEAERLLPADTVLTARCAHITTLLDQFVLQS
jgi:hypothetical protein